MVTAQSMTSEKMADVPMFSLDDQGNKVETSVMFYTHILYSLVDYGMNDS